MLEPRFCKFTDIDTGKQFVLNIGCIARITETTLIKKKEERKIQCRKIYLTDGQEFFVEESLEDIYDKIV